MHILFLSLTFPDASQPSRGAFNAALCRALAREHDVSVISPRSWIDVLKHAAERRSVHRPSSEIPATIDCRYPTYWYLPRFVLQHSGSALWHSVRHTVRKLSPQPDAVLSYWAHPDGEAGLRAARALDVPHVVIVGGSDVLTLPQLPGRRAGIQRVLCESDAVMTVSEGLRQAVISMGADPRNVHAIPQGIDAGSFHPGDRAAARRALGLPDKREILLWVGRMVPVKGLNTLLEAYSELRSRPQQPLLCLVGDGPERAELERLAATAQRNDSVRFVGAVSPALLPDWYRAADVTVLSSVSEGLPNVLRESLACGTPFVATDVGSIREIADPAFACLVAAGDSAGLAKAICTVLDGPHRAAAQKYVPRTWDECAGDVSGLLSHCRYNRHDRNTVDDGTASVKSRPTRDQRQGSKV